jgi:hypothetical protein
MLAASGPPSALKILERRRIEMIAGHDPGQPPFVYHAARALPLPAAEQLVREAAAEAEARGARALGVAPAGVPERLAAIGRTAGRPWAKDQKDSLLAALVSAGP